jgi:hypothetical protein
MRGRLLEVEERDGAAKPLRSVSCRRISSGGGALAAAAVAAARGSSAGSPSKKRAMAIYKLSAEEWYYDERKFTHLDIPLTPL